MYILSKITVDLARKNRNTRVEAIQGDVGTRCVAVSLRANGEKWSPPENAGAVVAYRHKSGIKGCYSLLADGSPAVRIQGNVATITLNAHMLSYPGNAEVSLVFTDPQFETLTSFPFEVSVAPNPAAGTPIIEDEMRVKWFEDKLTEILSQKTAEIDEAVQSAHNAAEMVASVQANMDEKVSKSDYAPEEKTAAMTQPVGKDASGRLWTAPTGGGSGSGGDSGAVVEIQADLDEMKSQIGNVRTAYSEYADLTPGEYVNSGIRGNLGEAITVTTSTSYFYYVLDNIYDKYLISTRIGKSTNYPHYIYGVDKDGVIVQTDLPCESTGRPVYKHTFIPNKDVTKIYVMLYLNTTVSYAAGAKLEFKAFQDQIDETLSIGRAGLRPARWLAMGDSITEGWFSQLSDTNEAISSQPTGDSANWVKIVAAFGGFEVTNNGIGGSGWVDKGSASYPSPSAREQIDGNWKGKEAPVLASYDLVTLALGLNDWKGAVDFGTWEDDILTADTVIANMRYVIEKITEANPNCKIIGISPMNCKYGSASKAGNWAIGCSVNGRTLEEAWAIMKGVYDHYNIETIDMLHGSSLNRNNLEALLIDGIHPSEKGHQLIGRELARKINFC